MEHSRDFHLIEELRAHSTESEWIEFKENFEEPDMVGELISALSNSARLRGKNFGYVVWGVSDASHDVVGTSFDPLQKKVKGQDFQMWLKTMLVPDCPFSFRTVDHCGKRLVLLEIPAALRTPLAYKNMPYYRVGSATTKLLGTDAHAELIDKLRPYSWESGIAASYVDSDFVLNALNYDRYFRLTGQTCPDNPAGILEMLEGDRIVQRDVRGRWNVTNLGAILFASDLSTFGPSMQRKEIRFVCYGGLGRDASATHRRDESSGYATSIDAITEYIGGLLPAPEHLQLARRVSKPVIPLYSIREVIVNALMHQDMTITGAGPLVEMFDDRIEVSNPGESLVETDRMLDLPPITRNEHLTSLMRRMEFCEVRGSGLDQVFGEIEANQLPAPLLLSDHGSTRVTLYRYRPFLEMSTDERVRACYFHAVLQFTTKGKRMRNTTLRQRLGLGSKVRDAALASVVIRETKKRQLIKVADSDRPRSGYYPFWA